MEIYLQDGFLTETSWNQEVISFNGIPGFSYNGPTEYKFELLAYDPVGNGNGDYIWDIDDVQVLGCCGGSSNCTLDETLDFTQPGIDWTTDATSGSFTVGAQTYTYAINDPNGIFVNSGEASEGILIGTDPTSVNDNHLL